MSNPTEENKPYPPWADLAITGKDLDPKMITELVGISPHRSHKLHDKKKDGIREWVNGAWILSSRGQVDSDNVMHHIEWLADQLAPLKNQLDGVLRIDNVDVKVLVFWIMPSTHEVLFFSPELLNLLAEINIRVEFSIYSPDA